MIPNNLQFKISAYLFACVAVLLIWGITPAQAQIFGHGQDIENPDYEHSLMQELEYRNIGPFRGGRSVAVSGHADQPHTYYGGFTGGGVYKTTDGGNNWYNVSDGYFKTGSVGAIQVAPSNYNVIYAGMGETCIRGNMSAGDGMYRSVDGGKTWKHIGLGDSHFIGEIVVHPDNEDVVWVAVLGHAFGMEGNSERGVYKTTDGVETWNKVLINQVRSRVLRSIRITRASCMHLCGKLIVTHGKCRVAVKEVDFTKVLTVVKHGKTFHKDPDYRSE